MKAKCVGSLGGTLVDDNRAPLADSALDVIHDKIVESEQRMAAPGLIADGQSLAGDAVDITRNAKRSWPLRLFVDAPAVSSLGVDTARLPPKVEGAAQ